MGKSYELVRKNINEVVDVRNNWFNNQEEAEEFYFQMKIIQDNMQDPIKKVPWVVTRYGLVSNIFIDIFAFINLFRGKKFNCL